jgi:hypothetical protein
MAYSVNSSQSTPGYEFGFALHWGPRGPFPLGDSFSRDIKLIESRIEGGKIVPELRLELHNTEALRFHVQDSMVPIIRVEYRGATFRVHVRDIWTGSGNQQGPWQIVIDHVDRHAVEVRRSVSPNGQYAFFHVLYTRNPVSFFPLFFISISITIYCFSTILPFRGFIWGSF